MHAMDMIDCISNHDCEWVLGEMGLSIMALVSRAQLGVLGKQMRKR